MFYINLDSIQTQSMKLKKGGKMRRGVAGIVALFMLGSTSWAADIIQDEYSVPSTFGSGSFLGQSFTATGDDTLLSIQVASDSDGTVNLRIYNGVTNCETTPGNNIANPGAISSVMGLTLPDTNPVGGPDVSPYYTTLSLTSPVAMTNGNQYTFCLEVAAGAVFAAAANNVYAGGDAYDSDSGGFWTDTYDFSFRVNTTPTVSVPLFGPFGYLILTSLFGFFGYRRLKS